MARVFIAPILLSKRPEFIGAAPWTGPLNKAAGLNIDLWAGIGMLVFAGLMVAWALWRPVEPEDRTRRAPAT